MQRGLACSWVAEPSRAVGLDFSQGFERIRGNEFFGFGGRISFMSRNVDLHSHPPGEDEFLSRAQLCTRWGVCRETIKRREKEGILRALRFNQRLLRYRLSDVLRIEAGAAAGGR